MLPLRNEKPAIPYSGAFFDARSERALRSASLIAPIASHLIKPTSVVDVGCGRGEWLRAFQELGITRLHGLDGEYVERRTLLVAQECFTCTDLSKPFDLPGRYDLAVCLEVAEHLPHTMASVLVDKLVKAAPAILFSAALPGQGGTQHVNERMPDYWRSLFRPHAYALLDPIRPAILNDTRIAWWYRQNTVLYASEEMIRRTPELSSYRMPEEGPGIEWVHVYALGGRDSIRSLSAGLVSAFARALRKKAQGFWNLLHPKPGS